MRGACKWRLSIVSVSYIALWVLLWLCDNFNLDSAMSKFEGGKFNYQNIPPGLYLLTVSPGSGIVEMFGHSGLLFKPLKGESQVFFEFAVDVSNDIEIYKVSVGEVGIGFEESDGGYALHDYISKNRTVNLQKINLHGRDVFEVVNSIRLAGKSFGSLRFDPVYQNCSTLLYYLLYTVEILDYSAEVRGGEVFRVVGAARFPMFILSSILRDSHVGFYVLPMGLRYIVAEQFRDSNLMTLNELLKVTPEIGLFEVLICLIVLISILPFAIMYMPDGLYIPLAWVKAIYLAPIVVCLLCMILVFLFVCLLFVFYFPEYNVSGFYHPACVLVFLLVELLSANWRGAPTVARDLIFFFLVFSWCVVSFGDDVVGVFQFKLYICIQLALCRELMLVSQR